jgi:CBS domain-containing protein
MGSGAALLGWLVGSSAPLFAATLYSQAVANLVLALFNLIPGFPLDGGEVLRALLWRYRGNIAQATYWSALVGQIVAYLLLLAGLWQLFAGNVLTGLWLGFVGWFMLQAANIANAQRTADALFQQTRVGKIMRPVPLSILPAFTLQEVVEDYLLPQGLRTVPVVENNRLIGLVTLSGIRHIPHSEWGYTSIRQVMLPLGRLHVATPHQSANEALSLMIRYDINQVPVVQADQIVGMVSREHLLRILEGKQAPEVVGTQLHTPATGFRVNSNEHTGRQAPEPAGSVLQPHAAQMDRTDHESA